MPNDQQHNHSYQANRENLLTESSTDEPINDAGQEVSNRLHSITENIHEHPLNLARYEDSRFGLSVEQKYLDCGVTLERSEKKVNSYISLPLVRSSLELLNLRSLKPVEVETEVEAYSMVEVCGNNLEAAFNDSLSHEHDQHNHHDENSLSKKLFATRTKRGSAQAELIKSLNNIRLNMSHQHLIEGSRNIMGKVRGLSMVDLNKQPNPSDHQSPIASGRKSGHYKTQFYALLTSLALLFLYLIYQNLFSEN